jgi:lysozyme family protein
MAVYTKVIKKILKWEGGFANVPGDTGGATMKGVTLSTYRQYFGKDKTVQDLKEITQAEWDYIFKKGYWDRWKADQIMSQPIANMVVDWTWGSGVHGVKKPQEVLGVVPDGMVGPKTLAAVNSAGPVTLFHKLKARRIKFYEDIVKSRPSQKKWLNGWLNRVNDLKYE